MSFFGRLGLAIIASVAGPMIVGTDVSAQGNPTVKSVVVAVLDNDSAFAESRTRLSGAKSEVLALVVQQDPSDGTRSLVIVNPAQVTPETLFAALHALRVSRASDHAANFTIITRQAHDPSDPRARAALSALRPIIASLLRGKSSHLPGYRATGRFAAVNEALLTEYFGTSKH